MPGGRYAASVKIEHPVGVRTYDHSVAAFVSFMKDVLDWTQIEATPLPGYPGMMHYEFSPEYKRRLAIMNKFVGPKVDLFKPLFFMSKVNISNDLFTILFARYFEHLRKTENRYPRSVNVKNLLYIRDTFQELRTSKDSTGPTELVRETEQDILDEVLFVTGDCMDTGNTWSGAFEAMMENRAAPISPYTRGGYSKMVTWGLLVGTNSDVANNVSKKGIPQMFTFMERKKQVDGWQFIDFNQANGYSKYIEGTYIIINEEQKKRDEEAKAKAEQEEKELMDSVGIKTEQPQTDTQGSRPSPKPGDLKKLETDVY